MLCQSHAPDDGSLRRLEWDAEHKEWSGLTALQRVGAEVGEEQYESNCEPPYWHVSIRYNAEPREESVTA